MKNKVFILLAVITFLLLIGNYFFTFNGFVSRSKEEDKICNLVRIGRSFDTSPIPIPDLENSTSPIIASTTSAYQKWFSGLPVTDRLLLNKYENTLYKKGCKSIEQFRNEEIVLFLLCFTAILLWYRNRE